MRKKRFLFVHDIYYPNPGTCYLSAGLKKRGFETDVIFLDTLDAVIHRIKEYDPAMMGLYCSISNEPVVKAFCEIVSPYFPNVPIVIGGHQPTYCLERFKGSSGIDYICYGEGDYALPELVSEVYEGKPIQIGGIKNLVINTPEALEHFGVPEKIDFVSDLDSLPFPDYGIYYDKKMFFSERYVIITTRGCPFSCAYCYCSLSRFKKLRRHSPEYIIEFLRVLINSYGKRSSVVFADDLFVYEKNWFARFAELYRRQIDIPYQCHVSPSIFDEDYARMLRESGCFSVLFGIETGNEKLRRSILKRNTKDKAIYETASLCRHHKIGMITYNMIGLPEETLEHSFETLEMNRRIKPDFAICSIYHPFPHTPLAEYAIERKLVEREEIISAPYAQHEESILHKPFIREQTNLQKFFPLAVRFPFLLPVIRLLITWKPNRIYDVIFKLQYVYLTLRYYRRSVMFVLRFGWSYYRQKTMRRLYCEKYRKSQRVVHD